MKDRLLKLAEKLKKGDLSVFDEFYELTKKQTFYSAYAVLKSPEKSEDILQDTYLKFLNMLNDLDLTKSISSLLITIARNLALNLIQKENRVDSMDDGNKDNYIGKEEAQISIDEEILLNRMKLILTNDEYEVVVLHVLDELKHKEIAELLNVPLGTITWRYNNAMKKLRKELKDDYE